MKRNLLDIKSNIKKQYCNFLRSIDDQQNDEL